MQKKRLVVTAVILVAAWFAFLLIPKNSNVPSAPGGVVGTISQPKGTVVKDMNPLATREELLKLVNEERVKNGAAPLVIDERLNQSAQEKVDDMVKNNYIAHESPINGRHGYELAADIMKYDCITLGENISFGRNDTTDIVSGWIGSDKHHKAMINTKYSLTGFGIANNLYVEHFCEAPN